MCRCFGCRREVCFQYRIFFKFFGDSIEEFDFDGRPDPLLAAILMHSHYFSGRLSDDVVEKQMF